MATTSCHMCSGQSPAVGPCSQDQHCARPVQRGRHHRKQTDGYSHRFPPGCPLRAPPATATAAGKAPAAGVSEGAPAHVRTDMHKPELPFQALLNHCCSGKSYKHCSDKLGVQAWRQLPATWRPAAAASGRPLASLALAISTCQACKAAAVRAHALPCSSATCSKAVWMLTGTWEASAVPRLLGTYTRCARKGAAPLERRCPVRPPFAKHHQPQRATHR